MTMFWKFKKTVTEKRDDGFPELLGISYYDFLERALLRHSIQWYLEIGTRNGRSLNRCQSNFIAIDPEFNLSYNIINGAKNNLIFQQTSDDFFASGLLSKLEIQPDIAFIDGMHLIEFVLRDFINCEKSMKPESTIFLHDVCPYNYAQTTRDITYMTELKKPWTGDVWKIIPILQKYRPDLNIDVFDAKTTGFGMVTNLDPNSRVLVNKFDEIMESFLPLTLREYGAADYYSALSLKSSIDYFAS